MNKIINNIDHGASAQPQRQPVLPEPVSALLDEHARQRLLDNKLARAQHYAQMAKQLLLVD